MNGKQCVQDVYRYISNYADFRYSKFSIFSILMLQRGIFVSNFCVYCGRQDMRFHKCDTTECCWPTYNRVVLLAHSCVRYTRNNQTDYVQGALALQIMHMNLLAKTNSIIETQIAYAKRNSKINLGLTYLNSKFIHELRLIESI